MVGVYERIFSTSKVFRAEPHATQRHLNEYMSLDMEMGFIDDHYDIMKMLEKVIRGIIENIKKLEEGESLNIIINYPLIPESIPVIKFKEVKEMYAIDFPDEELDDKDLSPTEERFIGKWALGEYNSDFIFVDAYPYAKRPFYTKRDKNEPEYTNSFDLIFRGTELVTGGQRLNNYQDYIKALEEKGISEGDMEEYLNIFKNGMPPHGGFGFGLERWLARLLDLDNIRQTALFPRDKNRISP